MSVFLCTGFVHFHLPNSTLIDMHRNTGSLGIARFNRFNRPKNGHFRVLSIYGAAEVRNLDTQNVNVR